MHKFIRHSAAVIVSFSLTISGAVTAYASNADSSHYGPGYVDSQPENGGDSAVIIYTDKDKNDQPADASGTDAPADDQGSNQDAGTYGTITFNTDEEAAGRAHQRTVEIGESAPYVAASALRFDKSWTPSFLSDDVLHNHGNGWYSIQMILRNTLGNVIYRTYSSTTDWSPWVMNGQETAHLTDGSAVEAVQIRLDGVISNDHDIYYQTVLSDGTTLDWAKNGQTAGSMSEGKWMIGLRYLLVPKNQQFPHQTAKPLSAPAGYDGVVFGSGLPTYLDGGGYPHTGWGWSGNQRYYFVDSQAVTGWQYIDGYKYYFDESGKLVSDLRGVIGDARPYLLKVNRLTDTLTVYAKDGDNGYILPIVSFVTTTGDDTPSGTFKIPSKYRWRLMINDVYTQYAMRITGSFLLHSVIYDHQDIYSLDATTYNNLGIGRSHGCTRLKTGEMKWIYDNCPVGTTIIIYDDVIHGPFERPVLDATIPMEQKWDPTDPNVPEAVAAMEQARLQQQQQAAAAAEEPQIIEEPNPSEPVS